MVVETDGYLALIEHLAMNMDIFTREGDTGKESVEGRRNGYGRQQHSWLSLSKTQSFTPAYVFSY